MIWTANRNLLHYFLTGTIHVNIGANAGDKTVFCLEKVSGIYTNLGLLDLWQLQETHRRLYGALHPHRPSDGRCDREFIIKLLTMPLSMRPSF